MLKTLKICTLAMMLFCFNASANAYAEYDSARVAKEDCAEAISHFIHNPPYGTITSVLNAPGVISDLTDLVYILLDTQNTGNYQNLQLAANLIVNELAGSAVLHTTLGTLTSTYASKVTSPRLVITEPDGTVIVDTGIFTGTGPYTATSTLANWQAKAINENHNSRVAILDTQLWPCGHGVETKYSSSIGVYQNYVAIRLGDYLDNAGTARLSLTID